MERPRGEPLQPRWVTGDGSLHWDRLVDGVRWFAHDDGTMSFRVESPAAVELADRGALEAYEGRRAPREFWLERSVAGFDILAGVDASVVGAADAPGLLSTEGLKLFTSSQMKRIFRLPDGKLLAVFTQGGSSKALAEVTMLHRISAAGFLTANPEIVDVTHGGERTMGIRMEEVVGTFVDLKVPNANVIAGLLRAAAAGEEVDTSEAGLAFGRGRSSGQADPRVLAAIVKDLRKILDSRQRIAINDLQFIVHAEGRCVIIDPQWAQPMASYREDELAHVERTYRELERALRLLTGAQAPRGGGDLRRAVIGGGPKGRSAAADKGGGAAKKK